MIDATMTLIVGRREKVNRMEVTHFADIEAEFIRRVHTMTAHRLVTFPAPSMEEGTLAWRLKTGGR